MVGAEELNWNRFGLALVIAVLLTAGGAAAGWVAPVFFGESGGEISSTSGKATERKIDFTYWIRLGKLEIFICIILLLYFN